MRSPSITMHEPHEPPRQASCTTRTSSMPWPQRGPFTRASRTTREDSAAEPRRATCGQIRGGSGLTPPMTLRTPILVLLTALLAGAGPALGMGEPNVAALQVALRAKGVYGGTIDGVRGPGTTSAVAAFQRRAGLSPDGVAGPRTRAALGRRGRPALGTRDLSFGTIGWDVASLQFLLAWHGFPAGPIDGHFGGRTDDAIRRFQDWAGLG